MHGRISKDRIMTEYDDQKYRSPPHARACCVKDNKVEDDIEDECGGDSHLGVHDDPAPLVNPQVLLDQRPIFLRKKTVREADEAISA